MALHIVADENIPDIDACFPGSAVITRVSGRSLVAADLSSADILLVRSVTQVNAALLQNTSIRFVGTATSGTEHVDQQWLRDRGIGFANASGSNANSVVEYLLCAISACGDTLERLMAGASVGVIGYGVIGREVVRCLRGLGIECCVYDPWLSRADIYRPASLERVLNCEVVTLHCELTDKQPWPSRHLLGEAQLAQLSPHQLLINASRGAVIDNQALCAHLQQPTAAIVVLDVWENEPDISCDLLERVRFGTAHIAGYSLDGKLLATQMLADAAAEFLQLGAFEGVGKTNSVAPAATPQMSANWEGAQLVRGLIQQRYDIREDDALLRNAQTYPSGSSGAVAVLNSNRQGVAERFDSLRKNYRSRREFRGSHLVLPFVSDSQKQILAALGCSFTLTEEGCDASK